MEWIDGVAGKRVSNADVLAAYKITGSVWQAGKRVGLSGQSVHERLRRMGINAAGNGRPWTDDEDAELRVLTEGGTPLFEIASRLDRTYGAVAQRSSTLGITNQRTRGTTKIPRGAGYDKASVVRHIKALTAAGEIVTKYARAHALNVNVLVRAAQDKAPDEWRAYLDAVYGGSLPTKDCPYCGDAFLPTSGKQTYCTRRCSSRAYTDRTYFNDNRRNTIGLAEGICQLCGRRVDRGLSSHHVLGRENDIDGNDLVALCSGCHKIITLLACRRVQFLDDPVRWETLINLTRLRAHGAEWALAAGAGRTPTVYAHVEIEDLEGEPE